MKIKLAELNEAQEVMSKVLGADLEFKLSYRLEKISNKVRSAFKRLSTFKSGQIQKYAKKDDKGKFILIPSDDGRGMQYDIKDEYKETFRIEWEKLLEEEIDLGIQLIPLDLLEKSGIKISGFDQAILSKFTDTTAKPEKEEVIN